MRNPTGLMIIAVLMGIATGEVVATVAITHQAQKAENAAQEEIRQAAVSGIGYRQILLEEQLNTGLKVPRKAKRATRLD